MIFNVMENKEELLFALKELNEGEVSDISSNLEQYILHVSKTGETMFAWQLVKPLLAHKLRRVSDDFYAEIPTDQLPTRPNMENVQYQDLQARVIEQINKFSGTPFTIQRLCELLVNPRNHYTRPDKFLRGIEKIVMVVSTVEAMKVANGSANSTSAALSDDEGSVSDAEKSVTGSGGLVNGVWGGPPTPPGPAHSPNRPSSPALDLTDRPDRPGPLSPTHPLSTTASAPHSAPGGDPDLSVSHLRPMGQLEAFVQNVSQRLTNQSCSPGSVTSNGTHPTKDEGKAEKTSSEPESGDDKADGEAKPDPDEDSSKETVLPDDDCDAGGFEDKADTKSSMEEEDGCDSSEKIDEEEEVSSETKDEEEPPPPPAAAGPDGTARPDSDEPECSSGADDRRDDRKREFPNRYENESTSSSASSSERAVSDGSGEPPAKQPRLEVADSSSVSSDPSSPLPGAADAKDDEVSESTVDSAAGREQASEVGEKTNEAAAEEEERQEKSAEAEAEEVVSQEEDDKK